MGRMVGKVPMQACYRLLGMRIVFLRETLGVTQQELALRLNTLTRASLANIETGRQRVLLHTVEEIAYALGTTPRGLMKGIWT